MMVLCSFLFLFSSLLCTRNIYWVDQGVPFSVSRTRRQTVIDTMVTKEVSRISVAKLDGSSPRTLVQGLSGGETEIVVNPRRG